MAEFVQKNAEEMIDELEQLERVGLFTAVELRQILKKRRLFEYKLRKMKKCKEDYLQYIQYEINLLALLKRRRDRLQYMFKKDEIEVSIIHRIHTLFRLVTNRFREDVKLWLSYIAFVKSKKDRATVGHIFTKVLQVHNKKPDIWILAAKWEMEDQNLPENARLLLQRGIQFNKNSKELWTEYFRMELMYADQMRKRKEILGINEAKGKADSDAVLTGAIANVVYKKALETIQNDIHFVTSFLAICQHFDFTHTLQQEIIASLKTNFSHKEEAWDAIARHQITESDDDVDRQAIELQERSHSHIIYKEAVQRLPTERMWGLYLRYCLESLNTPSDKRTTSKITSDVLDVFHQASQANCLSASLYSEWITVLSNVGFVEHAEKAAEKAVSKFPADSLLWQNYLFLTIRCLPNEDEIVRLFHKACKTVPKVESWPIWHVVLQYLVTTTSDQLEPILQLGSASLCSDLSLKVKAFYIDWLAVSQEPKHARKVHQSILKTKPVSMELYEKVINFELAQPEPRIKRLRQVYDEAILELGSSNPDLWLGYMKLETSHHKGNPEKTSELYFKAKKVLSTDHLDSFIVKYTLLQTGHV